MTTRPERDTRYPVVHADGVVYSGRKISLDGDWDARTVLAAVNANGTPVEGLRVIADEPPPVYEHVGCIEPTMGLRIRTALAKAARTRGIETPHDDALARARDELASVRSDESLAPDEPAPPVSHVPEAASRKQLAEARAETARLRERAATLRGRLQTRESNGLAVTSVAQELDDVMTRLAEAETELTAARQQLERARTAARARREQHERQFRLEERVANLERDARASLLEQIHSEYLDHLVVVPGPDAELSAAKRREQPFQVDPVTAALAIVRLASFSTPVVLACDRFDSPATASDMLDAAVVTL